MTIVDDCSPELGQSKFKARLQTRAQLAQVVVPIGAEKELGWENNPARLWKHSVYSALT